MLKSVTLYTALALAANTALAAPSLETLRTGEMAELEVHEAPRPVPEATLSKVGGGEAALSSFFGEPVVLNFWATWCAPCREEMPSLDRLQAEMGDRIEVLTVATGRPQPDAIRRFFEEVGLENLPMLVDQDQALTQGLDVRGLPVTVILDAEGREVARLTGAAQWDSPDAKALLAHLARN